jgi:F0F1-type ATP synthase assembly protein I
MKPPNQNGNSSVYLRGLALLFWVSWEIVALTSAGVLLGWGLHRWLGTPLLLSVVFGLIGLSAAFYRIFKASQKSEEI